MERSNWRNGMRMEGKEFGVWRWDAPMVRTKVKENSSECHAEKTFFLKPEQKTLRVIGLKPRVVS